ncbi:hypothetical protein I5G60_gp72 [Mycobacterium phage Saguaro]|uniref:Uncharacterized protein n=1 Tax=Mycobacterium phage Saguaro TaxID=2315616 RepID=A0A386KAK4_9CAUD|nr:hypothetical protein I5G60_gp72 [Mycobacterium phage Saguaro]AYD82087.1 hypothetical protein SEA_SAGUARO_72 [Mycobacterium phage Saguaro]
MRAGSPKIARSRRPGARNASLSSRLGGLASFAARGGRATGRSRHGPSIKKPDTYEALRRKGYSKRKAAAISNAQWNGTINHRGRRSRGGRGSRRSMRS